MPRFTDLVRGRWTAAALLALIAALAAGALALAQDAQRVESPHGKFREACSNCHAATAWKPARIGPKFDHAKYGFALEGAHASSDCMSCHTSLEFTRVRAQCVSCHQDPHRGELGLECARCHGARSFLDRGPMLRMHQLTRFPLTGSHASLDCESCHPPAPQGQMQFVGTQAECRACHMAQYDEAKTPDHVAGGFPTDCQQCHAPTTWNAARFDHANTAFPLTGAHRQVACSGCHGDGVYKGKPTDCASCHMTEYNAATPNHQSAGFPASACAGCHNTTQWAGASFDHNATAFPLTGAHTTVACSGCHGDGVYQGKSTACISCHQSTFDTAVPGHNPTDFPTAQCGTCHNTTAWTGATINHDTPYFPIYSGTHSGRWTQCAQCHANTASYASFTCMSSGCHSQSSTNSDHSGVNGYSYTAPACYSCHPKGRAG